jgi:hypothetical protein
MEAPNYQLAAELPGLEAAKRAIEARIAAVLKGLSGNTFVPVSAMIQNDPDVLGIDSIGRVIRRRKTSPKVTAERRMLIARARQARLERLYQEKLAGGSTPAAAIVELAKGTPAAKGGKK